MALSSRPLIAFFGKSDRNTAGLIQEPLLIEAPDNDKHSLSIR
ncbi:hypothetical protein ACVIW0_002136 [Bradyrhizobium sp. USDA 4454]